MIELLGKIAPIGLLVIIGVWGLISAIKARKSPPKEMRYYGHYLRTGMLIGSLACLGAAVVLTAKWLAG
jgi:hypothetical protein